MERLTEFIIPTNYNLLLIPNYDKLTFYGIVEITLDIKQSMNEIKLNGKNIKIISAELNNIQLTDIKIDEDLITFKTLVETGTNKLKIKYNGKINTNMNGLYQSNYTVNSIKKYLYATHFEPCYARQLFPCFDDPNFKATYELSLIINKDQIAISNNEILHEEMVDNKKYVVFQKSPKMSSYLLAFVIGDLDYIEGVSKNGIKTKIYIPNGITNKDSCKFALDVAIKGLDYYEILFDVPYPLKKLDLCAIPDFSAGAMENWGIITFRMTKIIQTENTTENAKKGIAETILHELVHQWFGNLVTMQWWDDLWLNEANANYFSWVAMKAIFPEWSVWEQFIYNEKFDSMEYDLSPLTHPIINKLTNVYEIQDMFDTITYAKGASIIRMMSGYIGDDKFTKGISEYIKKNQYKNSTSTELWSILGITDIINTWTTQSGFPLVTVQYDTNDNILSLSQKECGFKNNNSNKLWKIPLFINVDGKKFRMLLTEKDNKVKITGKLNVPITKIDFNDNSYGFYITQLLNDKQNINEIIQTEISMMTNINNSFILANHGYVKIDELIKDIANTFAKITNLETKYYLLNTIFTGLQNTKSYFIDSKPIRRKINEYIKNIANYVLKTTTTINDTNNNSVLLCYGKLMYAHDKQMIQSLFNLFRRLRKKEVKVVPELKAIIYATVVKYGNLKHLNKIMEIYDSTNDIFEKSFILSSLGLATKSVVMHKIITYLMTDKIKQQDLIYVMRSMNTNVMGKKMMYKYILTHYDLIVKVIGEESLITTIIKNLFSNEVNKDEIATKVSDMKNLLLSHVKETMKGYVNTTFDQLVKNINYNNTVKMNLSKDINNI